MNSAICSTATLIGIQVVVGGWKSHVFAIQNTKAAIIICALGAVSVCITDLICCIGLNNNRTCKTSSNGTLWCPVCRIEAPFLSSWLSRLNVGRGTKISHRHVVLYNIYF